MLKNVLQAEQKTWKKDGKGSNELVKRIDSVIRVANQIFIGYRLKLSQCYDIISHAGNSSSRGGGEKQSRIPLFALLLTRQATRQLHTLAGVCNACHRLRRAQGSRARRARLRPSKVLITLTGKGSPFLVWASLMSCACSRLHERPGLFTFLILWCKSKNNSSHWLLQCLGPFCLLAAYFFGSTVSQIVNCGSRGSWFPLALCFFHKLFEVTSCRPTLPKVSRELAGLEVNELTTLDLR